jgi:stage II sporulation protein D
VLRQGGFFGVRPVIAIRLAVWGRQWRMWAADAWTWRAPGAWPRLRLRRLRCVLHAVLAMTALYFFAGWFSGSSNPPSSGMHVAVWREDAKRIQVMEIEEYLRGVVAAEMPAGFHLEALKAQAVAARTYAIYTIASRSSVPGRPGAVLSTDHRVDQAWLSEDALRRQWGFLEFYWRWRRICSAVDDTRGMILTYAGDPILAVFHSDSGGVTEDSENCWSQRVPYLRSVVDPVTVASPHRDVKHVVSRSELLAKARALPAVSAAVAATAKAKGSSGTIEVIERYPSGRVKVVRVGDKYVSGRDLREALQLRSAWFEVSEKGSEVHFVQRGNGHGVGMSQYGANAYARQGADFRSILEHYYSGVELTAWY